MNEDERMRRLKIAPDDLEESFARSSGPGGQNVNKVSTAVTLRHRPSGLAVTVQDSRSQARNRALARARIINLIVELNIKRREEAQAKAARERRRKSPRPAGLKERILESKKRRSQLKKLRAKNLD